MALALTKCPGGGFVMRVAGSTGEENADMKKPQGNAGLASTSLWLAMA
jgi:hypothetical protein